MRTSSFGSNFLIDLVSSGYAPKSAKDREISDGSMFDKYFTKPNLVKDCKKKNGEVEDTVHIMRNLIRQKYGQVSQLANEVLAVRAADGSLDIYNTCNQIFNFVFKFIKYNLEDGEQLQTPRHTWYQAQVLARKYPHNNHSADCDCMAIFCGSCMFALGIPFALRIAGYTSDNYQHVYVVAYDKNMTPIICDPVMDSFNAEKPPVIQKTYSVLSPKSQLAMALQGTDIYVLDGIEVGDSGNAPNTYVEAEDGSLLQLSGTLGKSAKRLQKKAARKTKKAEKKQKKAEKKASKKPKKASKILARAANRAKTLTEKATKATAKADVKIAKKSGDKEAVKTANEHLKEVKKQIKAARKEDGRGFVRKVGKAVKNITLKTSLLIPRSMFLLLMRMNFRGLARRMSNNQTAYEKVEKVFKKLGGNTKKLKNAIEKGKSKKALFGSKKTKGDTTGQLYELGMVLSNMGCFGGLGSVLGSATGFAAAVASAAPIIKKVVDVMNKVGEFIPETADEASANGEDVAEGSDDMNITYEDSDVSDDDGTIVDTSNSEIIDNSTITDDTAYVDNTSYVDDSTSTSDAEIIDTDYEDVTNSDSAEDVSDEEAAQYDDLDPNTQIDEDSFDYEGYTDALNPDEIEDEPTETMEGFCLCGYEDGCVYVDDIRGLNGETLGKGFFKKMFNTVKNVASKVKSVTSKIKSNRANKKANKSTSSTSNAATSSNTASTTKKKGWLKNLTSKIKSAVQNAKQNKSNQSSNQSSKKTNNSTKNNNGTTTRLPQVDTSTTTANQNGANSTKSEPFYKKHPIATAAGGAAILGLLIWGGYELFKDDEKEKGKLSGPYRRVPIR